MKEHKVVLYKTQTCPWCHKTEEFFKEHKVKYKAIDVGANQEAAREMVEKSGQMGVPVIDIDGTIIVGFNKPALEKALNIAS